MKRIKAMARPCIGERAMTPAERQRRHRRLEALRRPLTYRPLPPKPAESAVTEPPPAPAAEAPWRPKFDPAALIG